MSALISNTDLASRSPSSRNWLWLLPIPLALALLYFALRGVEWSRVGGIVSHARIPVLLLGLAWSILASFARSQRWRILLQAAAPVRALTVFWANSLGYLGNNFLPGRAGELIRTMVLSSHSSLTRSYVFTTALVERAFDLLFLIIASALALATLTVTPPWLKDAARAMAAAGTVAAFLLALIPKTERLAAWALWRLPLPLRLREKVVAILAQVRLGVATLHQPLRFAQFLASTFAIWTMDVFGVMLLAYALHLHLSFAPGLLLVTGLGLSSAIPSTPGYVGVFQFVAVSILVPFGFSRSDALAFILTLQVLGYLNVAILGLVSWFKLNRPNLHSEAPPIVSPVTSIATASSHPSPSA